MTYMKSVIFRCDGEGCPKTTGYACWTATREREKAREDGWTNRGSEDYCPDCSENDN